MNPITYQGVRCQETPNVDEKHHFSTIIILKIKRWNRRRQLRVRRLMQAFSVLEDRPTIAALNLPRFRESEEGSSFWCGGVLAPDDKIYYIPGGLL